MLRVARNSFFGRSPDGILEPSWTGTPLPSPLPEGSFQVCSFCTVHATHTRTRARAHAT